MILDILIMWIMIQSPWTFADEEFWKRHLGWIQGNDSIYSFSIFENKYLMIIFTWLQARPMYLEVPKVALKV